MFRSFKTDTFNTYVSATLLIVQSFQAIPPKAMPITLGIPPPLPAATYAISSYDELGSVGIFPTTVQR